MNKTELIENIKNNSNLSMSIVAIRESISWLEDSGFISDNGYGYPNDTYRKVIQLLSRMPSLFEKQEINYTFKPADFIMSEKIANNVNPVVKRIRQELYGKHEPLFNNEKEAVDWLEKEARKSVKIFSETRYNWPDNFTKKDKLKYLKQFSIKEIIVPYFYYSKEKGTDYYVQGKFTTKNPRLIELMENIENLASNTSWSLKAALMHVLTGNIYIINTYTLQYQTGYIKSATLQINSIRDIGFNEWLEIYRKIKAELVLMKKKPLTKKDLKLYNFINNKRSYIWDKGMIEGYRQLQKEWININPGVWPNDKTGYESMRKAVERLIKKTGTTYLLEELNNA